MQKRNSFSRGSKNPIKKRAVGIIKPQKILIVSEGTQTEKNYFESFRVNQLDIHVYGEGANTVSLVRRAITYKDVAKSKNNPYTYAWVVFDRDSFPKENVEYAFELARENDINCAFSNEAFELWYLLHFDYRDTGMCRDEYKNALTRKLKFKYEKNSLKIFNALLPHLDTALKHANKLAQSYNQNDKYSDRNPYTSVHKLVELLIQHS
jgi:hypothetical protein